MKYAVAVLLLALPSIVCAEGPARQEFSFFSSFIQMLAALAIVIGLILLTRYIAGKLSREGTVRFSSKHIRVVETRYIAPKKALVLIETGGEYLLLSSTENSLTLLKQVHIIEEIEVVEDVGTLRSGLSGMFRKEAPK